MKRFIYLISPNKLNKNFYNDLAKVLSTNKVEFFQIRLKGISFKYLKEISKKIKKLTSKYKVKLIINDDTKLAKDIGAEGCHLGQNDESIDSAKKKLGKKIIGVTCHNSKTLCILAQNSKANYVALGSFFHSKLKPKALKADLKTLKWAKNNISIPIVAIGGINKQNFKKILKSGANYIALSSFIWNNPKLKPEDAIKVFSK